MAYPSRIPSLFLPSDPGLRHLAWHILPWKLWLSWAPRWVSLFWWGFVGLSQQGTLVRGDFGDSPRGSIPYLGIQGFRENLMSVRTIFVSSNLVGSTGMKSLDFTVKNHGFSTFFCLKTNAVIVQFPIFGGYFWCDFHPQIPRFLKDFGWNHGGISPQKIPNFSSFMVKSEQNPPWFSETRINHGFSPISHYSGIFPGWCFHHTLKHQFLSIFFRGNSEARPRRSCCRRWLSAWQMRMWALVARHMGISL